MTRSPTKGTSTYHPHSTPHIPALVGADLCVVDANNDRKRDSPDPWQRQLASGLGHQRRHFRGSVRPDEIRKQESVRE